MLGLCLQCSPVCTWKPRCSGLFAPPGPSLPPSHPRQACLWAAPPPLAHGLAILPPSRLLSPPDWFAQLTLILVASSAAAASLSACLRSFRLQSSNLTCSKNCLHSLPLLTAPSLVARHAGWPPTAQQPPSAPAVGRGHLCPSSVSTLGDHALDTTDLPLPVS